MDLRLGQRLIASIQTDLFHFIVLITAIFWYLPTACNSSGYYHPDEHYQIVEFARYKLGFDRPGDLAWEYNAAIRSAFQPAICFVVFRFCNGIGLEDPYLQAFLLRLLTALLSIAAISFFVKKTLAQLPIAYHKAFIVLSYFLWFLPFINVRFSSETWSGIFILLAVGLVQGEGPIRLYTYGLCGMCMGAAFLCRFQVGVMNAGLFLWLIGIRKIKLQEFGSLAAGLLLLLLLGGLLDQWLYGTWKWTAWNYFKINILDNAASKFGTAPWYRIMEYMINAPVMPLGIAIIVSIVLMGVYKPRSVYLWVMIPFLIVHALIPHKELRFLFPLVNFIPVVIIGGVIKIREWTRPAAWVENTLLIGFLVINLAGLLAMQCKAAGAGRNGITAYIYHHWKGQPVKLLYEEGRNPYKPWRVLREGQYEQKGMALQVFGDLDELNDQSRNRTGRDTVVLIVIRSYYWDNGWFNRLVHGHGYLFRMQAVPDWVLWLNRFYKGFNEEEVLALYEVQPH